MRPVNLIPPEDRRGDRAPLRSGPLSYVIIGGLAIVLLAVTGLVLTQNDIAEKEAEVAQLEVDRDAAAQEAATLAPYAEFASLQQSRQITIANLAQSRFDWERVMRELALVIPSDVTLTSLNGAAGGTAEGSSAASDTVAAPNLAASGCAEGHDAVGRFVAALEDIDGVTRVGLGRTEKPTEEAQADVTGVCGKANTFDLTIVFDNAAAAVAGVPATPASAVPAPATPASAAPVPTAPADSTVAENSANEQIDKAERRAKLVPGVASP